MATSADTTLRALVPPAPALDAFSLGTEEELFVVDPRSRTVLRATDVVLEGCRFARGQVTGEMCDGVVELATPVCRGASEVADVLAGLRRTVLRGGAPALMGVGVHPTLAFGDVHHRRAAHYDAVSAGTRSLLRQSTYCGVHVHVGMPDPETAVLALNGMRKWLPLLQALSANSPFWHGQDSGLASCRTVICHSVPRTRLPRAFRDHADYLQAVAELCRVGEITESAIWWDMRIHPRFGTLELRALDAQSSLRDLRAVVALAHCLAVHEALVGDRVNPAPEILEEATFRVVRDGLDATVSLGGPLREVRDLARHAMDVAHGYAARLGCTDDLEGLHALLDEGNGAIRQRRAYGHGGMPAVLRLLVDETHAEAAA